MKGVVAVDISGELVQLPRAAVEFLRAAAAVDAGQSSSRRDLSLILKRALQTGSTVVLRRGEARELATLTAEHPHIAELAELRKLFARHAP